MHWIWHLPQGDSNYSTRWRLSKSHFSRSLPLTEYRSPIRQQAGERGIWQRHYWEHLIRDEEDFQRHFDYVHINPLKHGLVEQVKDSAIFHFSPLCRARRLSARLGRHN